jgi:hypothetical protein
VEAVAVRGCARRRACSGETRAVRADAIVARVAVGEGKREGERGWGGEKERKGKGEVMGGVG